MNTTLRLLTLLGIFSLTLIGLTGCGEKRVHVSTLSGTPGEELPLEPLDESSNGQSAGLANSLVDELDLSSQASDDKATDDETTLAEPIESAMGNEPINMTHALLVPPIEEEPSNSFDTITSEPETALTDLDSSSSMSEGQDFAAQSRSNGEDHLNPSSTNLGNFQEPATTQYSDSMDTPFSQDTSAGSQDTLSGEGLEPLPEPFQIAKAEPSDSLQDRMDKIQKEELAAATAGLEDVFFQFDSWVLTPESKQSLERTFGWFEQDPSSNLIIEGHADQRGTQAYNMVLAKRRAVAVQEYLSQLGVDPSRMAVISYGKDKPFCLDTTEVCHQLNRRGHLLIPNP